MISHLVAAFFIPTFLVFVASVLFLAFADLVHMIWIIVKRYSAGAMVRHMAVPRSGNASLHSHAHSHTQTAESEHRQETHAPILAPVVQTCTN